jgi:hypothetical protein
MQLIHRTVLSEKLTAVQKIPRTLFHLHHSLISSLHLRRAFQDFRKSVCISGLPHAPHLKPPWRTTNYGAPHYAVFSVLLSGPNILLSSPISIRHPQAVFSPQVVRPSAIRKLPVSDRRQNGSKHSPKSEHQQHRPEAGVFLMAYSTQHLKATTMLPDRKCRQMFTYTDFPESLV